MVTPRQLNRRAEFYHQLAALTSAGVRITSALEMLRNSPPDPSARFWLRSVSQRIEEGATFVEGMRAIRQLPNFDLALMEAGENSGRLDTCFRFLSEYYRERARLARQILADLAYPLFILHLAILILPTGLLTRLVWQGEIGPFVAAKLTVLLPLYAGAGLLLFLGQPGRGEVWRSILERSLRLVPFLGAARANLALARLSLALESLLSAGVAIVEAWELAAAASGSPALRQTVAAWRPQVLGGQTPADAVRQSRAFPEMFTNLYTTGEMSGQLDQTLRRLYNYYQEEAVRTLQAVARWAPRLVYFGVVLFIAYQVVAFWSGYFSQINTLIQ